jgi:hypothetical protein
VLVSANDKEQDAVDAGLFSRVILPGSVEVEAVPAAFNPAPLFFSGKFSAIAFFDLILDTKNQS